MYCRHCTRRRKAGQVDKATPMDRLEMAIDYIKKTKSIRDVILTGGDVLTLRDEHIDRILTKLREVEHLEIIRLGTRTPVVMPMRINDSLMEILKKH